MSEADRFQELSEQKNSNKEKKIRLETKLESAKTELKKIVGEIRAAGFDHKTLKEDLSTKKGELSAELDKYEKEIKEQTEALDAIEG